MKNKRKTSCHGRDFTVQHYQKYLNFSVRFNRWDARYLVEYNFDTTGILLTYVTDSSSLSIRFMNMITDWKMKGILMIYLEPSSNTGRAWFEAYSRPLDFGTWLCIAICTIIIIPTISMKRKPSSQPQSKQSSNIKGDIRGDSMQLVRLLLGQEADAGGSFLVILLTCKGFWMYTPDFFDPYIDGKVTTSRTIFNN
jgi:hypothetical protein